MEQACTVRIAAGSRGERCQRRAVYFVPSMALKYPTVYGRGFLCGNHCPVEERTEEHRISQYSNPAKSRPPEGGGFDREDGK